MSHMQGITFAPDRNFAGQKRVDDLFEVLKEATYNQGYSAQQFCYFKLKKCKQLLAGSLPSTGNPFSLSI